MTFARESSIIISSLFRGLTIWVFPPFQSVAHEWFTEGRSIHYPVYITVHIKHPLPLIEKGRPRTDGSGIPF